MPRRHGHRDSFIALLAGAVAERFLWPAVAETKQDVEAGEDETASEIAEVQPGSTGSKSYSRVRDPRRDELGGSAVALSRQGCNAASLTERTRNIVGRIVVALFVGPLVGGMIAGVGATILLLPLLPFLDDDLLGSLFVAAWGVAALGGTVAVFFFGMDALSAFSETRGGRLIVGYMPLAFLTAFLLAILLQVLRDIVSG